MHSKNAQFESNIFVEKWTEVTKNMHIGNTDKNYFSLKFSDLCGLHFDAFTFYPQQLHFIQFDGTYVLFLA